MALSVIRGWQGYVRRQELQAGGMSSATQLQILLDCASGVDWLHSQTPPITHNDIKSMNFLVTSSPTLVVRYHGGQNQIQPHNRKHTKPIEGEGGARNSVLWICLASKVPCFTGKACGPGTCAILRGAVFHHHGG